MIKAFSDEQRIELEKVHELLYVFHTKAGALIRDLCDGIVALQTLIVYEREQLLGDRLKSYLFTLAQFRESLEEMRVMASRQRIGMFTEGGCSGECERPDAKWRKEQTD